MNKRIIATVSAMCAVSAGSLLTATPASANRDTGVAGNPNPPSAWVMPDLKGMVLFPAIKSVLAVTGGEQVKIKPVATGDRAVINQEDWLVCAQSPGPGKVFTAKNTITLKVERSKQASCP
ncbi:hypothetical protein JDV09_24620 [Mycobacterium sp. Y57]|uniref:hypothetical protein n=1 Tax=Mycolicibacterium xanthum TaxID=2796469 RepID=UPI001C853EBE|nr:hypothetical protein [Mycolicibacterium xanthum]MBX7435258.1 hypothetical protein [Mycolicibacterium xanthum]